MDSKKFIEDFDNLIHSVENLNISGNYTIYCTQTMYPYYYQVFGSGYNYCIISNLDKFTKRD